MEGHLGAAPGRKAQDTASRVSLRMGLQPGGGGLQEHRQARQRGTSPWPTRRLALTPRRPQLALEHRCRELRTRGRRLEETLPRRIGSEEQREVLSLLCRVHELEVENTEMQSHALLRDGALRHRREAVRRLEQHRSLCDEIIQGQRQIIDGRPRAPEPPGGPLDPRRVPGPELSPAHSPRQTTTWPSRSTWRSCMKPTCGS